MVVESPATTEVDTLDVARVSTTSSRVRQTEESCL